MSMSLRRNTPARLLQRAKTNIGATDAIYMNGKYIHPYITSFDHKTLFDNLIYSIDPTLMGEIGNFILNNLMNKLEEHGKNR